MWPPTIAFLDSLEFRKEETLIEYKRQWPDIESQVGKGEFVKDALALANAVAETEVGLLLFGLDETTRGAIVVGTNDSPKPETISQILQNYTSPTPIVRLASISHPRGTVSV